MLRENAGETNMTTHVECHKYVNSSDWTVYVWVAHKLWGEVLNTRRIFPNKNQAMEYARELRRKKLMVIL